MKSIFKKIIVSLLILESKLILKKYKPEIIAVTGSVGKTSTKDAIYTVVSNQFYTRKSEKSFNSELGVPLTILGCQNGWNDPFIWIKNLFEGLELILFKSKYPKCLVLEVGADHPNDIKNITKWLKPDISVITKISEVPVHVEFFPSPEAVLEEKMYLAKALKKDGVLIISLDDRRIIEASKDLKNKIFTFGINNHANINASDINMDINDGIWFKLSFENENVPVNLKGVLGIQHIYPIIAAAAVGISKNIPIEKIIESIKSHIPPKGRMNILSGINNSKIIDDTYNSSPDALKEALSVLSKINCSGRKIAVLGDMMELGKFSADEHRKAGELAIKSCDILITVGPRARLMNEKSIHFDSSILAGEYVKTIIAEGDIVLIKGSQSIRLEKAVKILLSDSSKSKDLLVRQEPEWLAKK